ncbi:MAG: AraC-like DNA-binding protein [Oceanicoccus sp.]|jgi:AraC-like DNA-binding protein
MPPEVLIEQKPEHTNVGRQLLHSFEIQLMVKDLVQSQGLSLASILKGTGVAARELENPSHRLTLDQELALYTRIAHFNTDASLPLRVGVRLGLPNYGILGTAMSSSATVKDALQLLVEFAPLVSWASHSRLENERYQQQQCLALILYPTPTDILTTELEVDSTLASLQSVFTQLLGEEVQFAAVDIEHSCRQGMGANYEALFSCPVNFNAGRNALLLSKQLLQRRLPHAQPEYVELLRDLCRESQLTLTGDRGLVAVIKNIITDWQPGVPTLDQVSKRFNQSSRTLRRHLHNLGVSYQSLLDEMRYSEARRYLQSTHLTVETIAQSLGYADARSFRAAFKRWSGISPVQYRATAGD